MAPKAPKKSQGKKSTKGIPAPKAIDDPVDLADWLELTALSNKDRNASKADLQRLLTRAGGYNPAKDSASIDALCLSVFIELESRPIAAPGAYPFEITLPLLRVRPNARTRFPAYIFCLCLSAWRWIKPKDRPDDARQLFEDLSCFAAKNFVGGEALRFASPRQPELKTFSAAIDRLCEVVGEGVRFRADQDAGNKKDDTLDVVAWRHFPDKRAGKIVLFGQCASGGDWLGKRPELQPRAFIGQWIERDFTVDCLRAFFVPHRVSSRSWEETNRKAGIAFDRCRVSYWAHQDGPIPKRQKLVNWCQTVIKR